MLLLLAPGAWSHREKETTPARKQQSCQPLGRTTPSLTDPLERGEAGCLRRKDSADLKDR